MSQLSAVSHSVTQLIADSIAIDTIDVAYSSVSDRKDIIRLPEHQYPTNVRVVGAGPLTELLQEQSLDFPVELCGGT